MPKSRHRNIKTKPKKTEVQGIVTSEFLRFWTLGHLQITIMNIGYLVIALAFLNKTDKISPISKLVFHVLLLTISFVSATFSYLSIRESGKPKPNLRRLERMAVTKAIASLTLSVAAGFLPVYVSKYPKQLEVLITVTFPSVSAQAAATISKSVTFLTTGVMGIMTTIAINVLSNYIYDKFKRKKKAI